MVDDFKDDKCKDFDKFKEKDFDKCKDKDKDKDDKFCVKDGAFPFKSRW